ncbi:MAG: hypothetical protein ABIJ09_07850 [Pseudomonadota bacterium]
MNRPPESICLALLLPVLASACVHVELTGKTDLTGPLRATSEPVASFRSAADIEVWVGNAPQGVELNNDVVTIAESHRDRIALVGRAAVTGEFIPQIWVPLVMFLCPCVGGPYFMYYAVSMMVLPSNPTTNEALRAQVTERLKEQAAQHGADAIVFVNYYENQARVVDGFLLRFLDKPEGDALREAVPKP